MSDQYAAIRPLYASSAKLWEETVIARGGYMMDIGAHKGGYSASAAPNCRCIDAFEPVAEHFIEAKKLEGIHPNFKVYKLGMSDQVGVVKNVNVFNTCSLLPDETNLPAMGYRGTGRAREYSTTPAFDIAITTVDWWTEIRGMRPDLIKLDVDGYELRVLKGATETLREKPCPIMFEYSFLPKFLGDSIEEMAELIYSMGYRAWAGDGSYVAPDAKAFLQFYPHDTSYDVMLIHSSQR